MAQDLGKILRDLSEGGGPSILLLFGDDFRVREATRALLNVLTPDSDRSANTERYDGRSCGLDEVEAALMTPSLFASRHAVLVDDAPYFAPQRKDGQLERAVVLWAEGQKDAGGHAFMNFLNAEGWTAEQWLEADEPSAANKLARTYRVDSREVEAVWRYCREQGLRLERAGSSDQMRLDALIDRGLPEGAFLILLASQVDRRTRLFKKLTHAGCVLDLSLERDRSGRIRRESLAAFLDQRLRKAGKRIEPRAKEMVLARSGDELWTFHQEIEKLVLYVGDAGLIRASDVQEVFTDRAEGWVFDLTDALGRRDILGALGQLRRLMDSGEYPLRLLGAIASEVRRLLQCRELLDTDLAGRWRHGMSFQEFQRLVTPERKGLPTTSPYVNYLALQRAEQFSSRELKVYHELILEADARLKSSGHGPYMAMERLLIEMSLGTRSPERDHRTTGPQDR